MISALWLLLIVPGTAAVAVFILGGFMRSSRTSECERCPRVLEALAQARKARVTVQDGIYYSGEWLAHMGNPPWGKIPAQRQDLAGE
jgi:hypothetical protein